MKELSKKKRNNKYVDFVSDKDFLECVNWVCDAYREVSVEIDMTDLKRNAIDPFKLTFDVINGKMSIDSWIKNEHIRQQDKTINNRIGEFHQKLLGKVKGWSNLGTGDESHLDLKNDDNTIFIELKNKENTVNADSLNQVREKLERAVSSHTGTTAYWAFIVSNRGSGESEWIYRERSHRLVRKIWGSKVYELVTGKKDALEQTWKAIPKAIIELTKSSFKINVSDQQKLSEFFESAFGK